jgi:hypothetical protein
VTTNVVPQNLDRVPVALPPAGDPLRTQVPLERSGGGMLLGAVEINGTLTLDALIDSGAAAVIVPADVFARLQGMGAVEAADLGGQRSSTLAVSGSSCGRFDNAASWF